MASVAHRPVRGSYFSLRAKSPAALKVISSPRNKHLCSKLPHESSSQPSDEGQASYQYGLNIGPHIPQKEHDLLATIGRTGDIIVEKDYVPRLQCSFRINKETGAVLFYDYGDTKLFENNITDTRKVNDFRKTSHGSRVVIAMGYRTVFGFGGQHGEEFKFEIVWHKLPQQPLPDDDCQRVRDPSTLSIPLQRDGIQGVEVLEKGWGPKLKLVTIDEIYESPDGEVAVSKAIDIYNGKALAVKVMRMSRNPNGARHIVQREVEALSKLEHRNVIQIMSAHWDDDSFQIITPCYDGNAAYLKQRNNQFNEHRNFYPIQDLFRNMLSALNYVHSKGIMHRDVKPQNILYTQKLGEGNAVHYEFKLADFGSSNQTRRGNTCCGTPGYMAPEIAARTSHTSKADIWSLFATLCFFLDISFGPQIINNTIEDWNKRSIRSKREYKVVHFIADMYDARPDKRPSAAELKERLQLDKHKRELLVSSTIPGFPESFRVFTDSSTDLSRTPQGTVHPAHRPARPSLTDSGAAHARQPSKLRPARPVLGLEHQTRSPSVYSDDSKHMVVPLGISSMTPTGQVANQPPVDAHTHIATSSPGRRDELTRAIGRSQSTKSKWSLFRDR